MNAFTYIGIAVTALAGVAVIATILSVTFLKLRGGYTIRLRRWEVVDALGQSPEPAHGIHGEGNDELLLGRRFTFKAARRLAKRTYGARIFNIYDCSFAVARQGWSESENGFSGTYIPIHKAAELLGVADDGVSGPARWESARRILGEATGAVSVSTGDYNEMTYNARDVLALARMREHQAKDDKTAMAVVERGLQQARSRELTDGPDLTAAFEFADSIPEER
jgi:hypothetical protein